MDKTRNTDAPALPDPYYMVWQGARGWYCATLYPLDTNGDDIGQAWEDANYVGPSTTAKEALTLAKVDA